MDSFLLSADCVSASTKVRYGALQICNGQFWEGMAGTAAISDGALHVDRFKRFFPPSTPLVWGLFEPFATAHSGRLTFCTSSFFVFLMHERAAPSKKIEKKRPFKATG